MNAYRESDGESIPEGRATARGVGSRAITFPESIAIANPFHTGRQAG